MPDADYDAISNNPAQLLTWMNTNLVLAGTLANTTNPSGTAFCTFEPRLVPPVNAQDSTGNRIDAYYLKSYGVVAAPALHSYICNYLPGQVHSVQLGGDANFCFTVTLNGCTFGIGQPAQDGSVRVSHANTGGRTAEQRDQTWQEHGVGANSNLIRMLEPAAYRRIGSALNLNATVFGLRDGPTWKFYFQLYSVSGGQFTLHGVFPIVT